MQLGAEVLLEGEVRRDQLEQMLADMVCRWPQLARRLHTRLTGLAWGGESLVERMLHVAEDASAVTRWRNQPLDPFREPPFQLLWIRDHARSRLAFRAHHAVADGEAFFNICAEALRLLARLSKGEVLPSIERAPKVKLRELIPSGRSLLRGQLTGMWRYTRWLAAEAKAGRSARLAAIAQEPGEIAIAARGLNKSCFAHIRRRAAASSVTPAALCAAAWVRAIGAWNARQGSAANSLVSLEMPISMRRGDKSCAGNLISPLIVFVDAAHTLERVAVELQTQLQRGVRQRSYMGMPLFTAPARFLPWPLFRRLAVNTTSTGFATSHFTWLKQKTDIYEDISALSGGALRMLDHHIYTPVCLHMGAALAVILAAEGAKLSLTYRLTAFDSQDAEALLDLVLAELKNKDECRGQFDG
jgi:NRPS condensation-like uncharacterized protein